jgi:dienelactone hydrolase
MIAALAIALAALTAARSASALAPPTAPPDAFLTFESGVLVAVDWIERDGSRVHTRSVLTQSRVLDATIELRDDGTAVRSTSVLSAAGGEAGKPVEKAFDAGTIYWSDMIASSVEQAVLRAQRLNQRVSHIPAASLFSASRGEVEVERRDATDWVVSYHHKRYEALTDENGRMLAATLPDYGVTIERRSGFAPGQYPLWPPHAAPPDRAYAARDVRIRAPGGHVLAGTLTSPHGHGSHPAVVLITGLSPNNRDEGEPPWMPLRDLADALSRAGLVVLRVDDRGVGESTGDRAPSTTFDEADDVRTEMAWLRAQPGVDGRRIALVGYSEGGLIAPMVAAGDSSVAAIVTLAGPGVPGLEVGRYQIEAAVVADSSIAAADREKEIQKQLTEGLTPREKVYLGLDPLEYARRVRCPVLVVQGGADLHVPLRSAERLATAMRAGGNRDVTVRIFPGVSHSLLPDPNGLSSGWVLLPAFGTSPQILETVANWTSARLGLRRPPTGAQR